MTGSWYVIRSNIKAEHKARKELQRAGFAVYLPEFRIERINRRLRKRISNTLCLFPRYLFVQQHAVPDWYAVRACNGVESVLGIDGTPIPVASREIQALMEAQANLEWDDTEEARIRHGLTKKNAVAGLKKQYRKGSRVRITDGPFASFLGLVKNVKGLHKIDVMVELFGRLTPVELEPEQVEPVSRRAA